MRSYLSWNSILSDIQEMKLTLDNLQGNQVRQFAEQAGSGLNRMISECYRWLLCPAQTLTPSQAPGNLTWEIFALNGHDKSMISKIEEKLIAEQVLIKQWAPIHLNALLNTWFWKEGRKDIGMLTVWKSMCDYLYMPRLASAAVFQQAISQGVQSGDYFSYADGQEGQTYKGLKLGLPVNAVIDPSALIVHLEAAKAALSQKTAEQEQGADKSTEEKDPQPGDKDKQSRTGDSTGGKSTDTSKKRFFGTVELDPHTGRMDYDQIHQEIISLLTTKPGHVVTLRLDIEARAPEGFDENLQRAVRENSNALKFDDAEFE